MEDQTMEPPLNPPQSLSSSEQPPLKKPKMSTTTSDDESAAKPHRYKRRKIAIFFAYCGVGYQGMQKNPGAKTIEGDLEEALFFSGAVPEADRGQHKRFDLARSARTDKGVSAVGQVVSGRFYVDPNPGEFVERLNSNLSPQIRVFGYKRVTPSFNAKKFCDRRRYVYLLPVFALDARIHRDRESVMASLGSGNELAKCFECSERGRKVLGVMGNKRDLIEFQSGISSNTCDALLSNDGEIDVVGVNSEGLVHSGISSNTDDALNGGGIDVVSSNKVDAVVINDDIDGKEKSGDEKGSVSEVLVQSGISSNSEAAFLNTEVSEKDQLNVSSDDNGVGELKSDSVVMEEREEKRSEFKYDDEVRDRFNRILKHYVGTHNFHNFTTRTKPEDPSAKRYIVSFEANTTLTIEGIEFVKCEVVGQSFMLHQIRKMMGMAVSVMRNFVPESIYERAFDQDFRINVPTAPEVGLYLDECMFTSYNNKWKNTHEEVSMNDYAQEAEKFKFEHIYSHIAKTEQKEGSVAVWLHSLNLRNYPELRFDGGEVERAADDKVERTTDDLPPHNGEVEGAVGDEAEKTADIKVGITGDDDKMEGVDDGKLARGADDMISGNGVVQRAAVDEAERAAEDSLGRTNDVKMEGVEDDKLARGADDEVVRTDENEAKESS